MGEGVKLVYGFLMEGALTHSFVDGCFRAHGGRGESIIRWRRLYSFSRGLYPRRVALSPNMCGVEVDVLREWTKGELKFIWQATSYHPARLAFHLYQKVIPLFCDRDGFAQF